MQLSALFLCLCLLPQTLGEERVVVEEGSDVILPCSLNGNIESELFEWKKGRMEVFSYDAGIHHNNNHTGQDGWFIGRVSHFQEELRHGNASVKINRIRKVDSGDYTCDFPRLQSIRAVSITLYVLSALLIYPDPEPEMFAFAQETCMAKGVRDFSVTQEDSDGKPLPVDEHQTLDGYRVNITINTTVYGHFHCVIMQKLIDPVISAQIYVHSHDDTIAWIDSPTNISARLQCETNGPAQLEVKWQDSAGNILPAEEHRVSERPGREYITLNTTVNNTGHFLCVVKENNSNYVNFADIGMYIDGAAPTPRVRILEQGVVWTWLQCEAHGVPDLEVHWQDSDGNKLPAEEPQVTKRGGRLYITLDMTVIKRGCFSCVATQKYINHRISSACHVSFGWKTILFVILFPPVLLVNILLGYIVWSMKINFGHGSSDWSGGEWGDGLGGYWDWGGGLDWDFGGGGDCGDGGGGDCDCGGE
ncbi:leucine-rich repeats and immunoglobulin-like domains protein 2 isoform X1 [Larimichthys crocea]|uniref:leucine-rich repeats and immunoglobulin-like domains protein 2 isoform X1 n=2 Tax=Larimichthys crocea TaxID=215358 RepID=UPI000F5F0071|nr:leucine-rich repeats and immunoglobulin-like domains protein 2 isoform X1 [Larimichthys crocea]